MPRQTDAPVTIDVTIDRQTFRQFQELYLQLGQDFREVIQKELQQTLNENLQHKANIFKRFGQPAATEVPSTVPTVAKK